MWGPTFPELVETLLGIQIIDRSSVNAFDDARVARAIEATGRKKLIFAGISLEVCAAFPAITAVGKGLDAHVGVDASGTFSGLGQACWPDCPVLRKIIPRRTRAWMSLSIARGERMQVFKVGD
jgi:nicotinamidase-related amidase